MASDKRQCEAWVRRPGVVRGSTNLGQCRRLALDNATEAELRAELARRGVAP